MDFTFTNYKIYRPKIDEKYKNVKVKGGGSTNVKLKSSI